MNSVRGLLVGAVGAPAAAAAFLAGQAYRAAIAPRPDLHPDYDVEARVAPSGAGGTGDAVDLVVFGDSTAAGVGSPTLEEALPVLLAERVADRLGRDVHVIGHGVSGARTADVTRDQFPLLAARPVDVAIVLVGSNDVTRLTRPATMRRRTRALLDGARRAAGGAPVVLGGIPLFQGVPALPEPLRSLVEAHAGLLRSAQRATALALEGVTYVDIAAEASPRFRGRPEAMSADGYHPSPVGYGLWADALTPAVVAAAGAGRGPRAPTRRSGTP